MRDYSYVTLPPPRVTRVVRKDGWVTGYYENGHPAYHLRDDGDGGVRF